MQHAAAARDHIRSMLAAASAWRDPLRAIEAICAALESMSKDDRAFTWLQVAVRSTVDSQPVPIQSMGPLLRALRALHPQPRPAELRLYAGRAGKGLTILEGHETLPEILDRIANQRGDQGPTLLARFLRSFAGDTTSSHYGNLAPVRDILDRMDLPEDPDTAQAMGDYRLIVQVRLEPEDAPHIEDASYGLYTTCYRQPRAGGAFTRVSHLAQPMSLRTSELTTHGSNSLTAWEGLTDELQAVPSPATRIEFVLPSPLLGHPAELWATGPTRQALGHHHPVVVRSRERYIDSFISRQSWQGRWSQLSQGGSGGDVLELIGWPAMTPGKKSEFSSWIMERPALACLGLRQPYEQLDPLLQEAVNAAMFTDGVPAVLWVRTADKPETLLEALRLHNPSCLADLPDVIHQCRLQGRGAADSDVRNHITLLWEDPDCVDRKQDLRFTGMVS
ncbi:hypothetical protein DER30_6891 [Streptomyces sp. HB202]|nr:hypothetical protein DER30_6891 [Streptomyces sp. HB202]